MTDDKRPHGRPNEMEPALIAFAHDAGPGGFMLMDAARAIPAVATGRRTYRALTHAAGRLLKKGVLRTQLDGLFWRYWHTEEAPVGALDKKSQCRKRKPAPRSPKKAGSSRSKSRDTSSRPTIWGGSISTEAS